MRVLVGSVVLLLSVTASGCDKKAEGVKAEPKPVAAAPEQAAKGSEEPENPAPKQDPAAGKQADKGADPNASLAVAEVGKPAPDFTLPGVDGKTVKLSDHKGKVVVLEWYNPDCPFVKWAHNEGPLQAMAATYADKGVVWLAINSGAPGKQGHGLARNQASLAEYKLSHPILLDEPGTVGKAYGATNTPQLYVVGKDGALVYAGGLDNLPFGEQSGPGEPRKHCEEALTDVLADKPVRVPKTKPWGCTVKYGA